MCFDYSLDLAKHDPPLTPEEREDRLAKFKANLWKAEEVRHVERARQCFKFAQASLAAVTAKHITIRPRDDFTDWPAFRAAVLRFVASDLFTAKVWSFEQKGTTAETLGTGFHVHIVVRVKPGRFLSHIKTAADRAGLLKMCGNAGFQVDLAKTPTQLIQGYLLDYLAPDDEHKEITQVPDAHWRRRENLRQIYGDLNAFDVTLEEDTDTALPPLEGGTKSADPPSILMLLGGSIQ